MRQVYIRLRIPFTNANVGVTITGTICRVDVQQLVLTAIYISINRTELGEGAVDRISKMY